MASLLNITFTGVDDRTDLVRLRDIQRRYPLAEFGVLLSATQTAPRYPSRETVARLRGLGLSLSAHLCGSIAREAYEGDWTRTLDHCSDFDIFRRCQLNVAGSPYVTGLPETASFPDSLQEVIIQQHSGTAGCQQFLGTADKSRLSVLIDDSGDRGRFGGFKPMPGPYRVGYAGGIGPDNVAAVMQQLMRSPVVGRFWIDKESKVRDAGDWLDLDKVEAVLETVERLSM